MDGIDDDFPPLSKEILRHAREKGKSSIVEGRGNMNKGGHVGGQSSNAEGFKRAGGKNYKASLAGGTNTRGSLSVSFD